MGESGAPQNAQETTDDAVVDAIVRAVARSESGFDAEVLGTVFEALRGSVAFEQIVVSLEEEDGQSFRIFARAGGPREIGFPIGVRVRYDADVEGFGETSRVMAPVVIDDVGARGTPLDKALHDAGVRSYVTLPVQGGVGSRVFLSITSRDPQTPFRSKLALFARVARTLEPAFGRIRSFLRWQALAALVESSPDGMLALDGSLVIRECNLAAVRMLGRARLDVIGKTLATALGPDAAARVQEALAPGGAGRAAGLAMPSQGGELPLLVDATIGAVVGETEVAYHLHLRDARERRAVEAATTRRLEHLTFLRALGESLGSDLRVLTAVERALDVCIAQRPIRAIAALRADDTGTLRLVAARGTDPSLVAQLGWIRRDQLESLRVEGAWSLALPLSHARRTWGTLFVVGRGDGEIPPHERELWDSVAATVAAAVHAAQDFEHVVELEAEKRVLVDSLPVIVARVEPALGWATSFVNGAAERILGVTTAELSGLPGLDGMLDATDKDAAAATRKRAARGEKVDWQDRHYRHKDGRAITLREYVYPVLDADGSVRSVQIIAYDVTTEIESRRRLIQTDRLASLGALAAGIAHEINNPVAFIGLAAGQLPRQTDPERVKELSREIGEAAHRIAHIVGELKLFTRIPDGAAATPVDINRMLETAITLTSAEVRRRARLDVVLGELPLAPGRFSSLGQAFVNLLLNGAQAVELAPFGAVRVVSVTSCTRPGEIVVEFTDSGPSIPREDVPRIFDPFFASERSVAGLGLSIAYDIVRRGGGDLRVGETPSGGAKFEVVLPIDLADSDVERDSPLPRRMTFENPNVAPNGTTRRRVLIIDDELALAKALARQLANRYDVDTAGTAADALAQLAVHSYDAVVCDLRMPDQSGPSIHAAVKMRAHAQAERFIFTTGGSYGASDDEIHERAKRTGRPVLEKPFDGQSFEALVAEVVGAPVT
jgi:PAS domain S-box-containing protein